MPDMLRSLLPVATAAFATASLADTSPRVVADIAPIHSLVAQVMQGVGTPELLVPADASPHGYVLRPSEARSLADAQVIVSLGDGLLPWIEDRTSALAPEATYVSLLEAPVTKLLDGRDLAVFLDVSVTEDSHDHAHGQHAHGDHGHKEHGHAHGHTEKDQDHDHAHDKDHGHAHDHAEKAHNDHAEAVHDHGHHGHAHGAGHMDPHAWLDPENASVWLAYIADTLSTADPGNAETYQANAKSGQQTIAALQAEMRGILQPVTEVPFLVYHDAYQYFEHAFDLSVAGAIAASDAVTPGPARLAELRDLVQDAGISCIFAEPQFSPRLANTLTDGADLTTATLDPIGMDLPLGPELYAGLLRNLATDTAGCLSANLGQ